jgi:hypothetical protein
LYRRRVLHPHLPVFETGASALGYVGKSTRGGSRTHHCPVSKTGASYHWATLASCSEGDSNPQGLLHWLLRPARIPFRHLSWATNYLPVRHGICYGSNGTFAGGVSGENRTPTVLPTAPSTLRVYCSATDTSYRIRESNPSRAVCRTALSTRRALRHRSLLRGVTKAHRYSTATSKACGLPVAQEGVEPSLSAYETDSSPQRTARW